MEDPEGEDGQISSQLWFLAIKGAVLELFDLFLCFNNKM